MRLPGIRLHWILAALFAAGVACAADQAESRRVPRDAAPDANPNSDFWRAAPAIFAVNDGRGNPVPGHKTEIRSLWTPENLYFLFICPYESLNLKPEPKTTEETN